METGEFALCNMHSLPQLVVARSCECQLVEGKRKKWCVHKLGKVIEKVYYCLRARLLIVVRYVTNV